MLCSQIKEKWSWLALRTARDEYLQHFGKIGTGDVLLLAQEIEKEEAEKERALQGEVSNTEIVKDERGTSPVGGTMMTAAGQGSDATAGGPDDSVDKIPTTSQAEPITAISEVKEGDADVKMDTVT